VTTIVVDTGRLRPRARAGEILIDLPRTNRFPLGQETQQAVATGRRPRRPWPLPRRQREPEVFTASAVRIAWRVLCWAYAGAHYGVLRFWDRLRGRSDATQRGVRLRQTLERLGGTFVKLGQQLSTRLDLLPFETCRELSSLLDDMPAFPTTTAIEIIERTTGRPLAATFTRFDPVPLGSMAVACVYHAVRTNGEEVVVKVRRPKIGTRFAADLAALDLICRAAEGLTLVRIGFTRALRSELRTMILEELDLQAEARYQELFRSQARRDRQPVSAPRVHYDCSSREVLVSDYVRGVWLQDLIRAKETRDDATLAYLATLGITPRKVARRLLRAFYWSTFETLFYHADPHPGNVLVRPNGELLLTNFGACGPTTHRSRRNYAELFRRQANRDLDGIVQVFGSILSPLPQTDVHGLLKAAEAKVARWQYGYDSKHAEWWERGSAGLWIGILEMAREHRIPVSVETVRFFRACLLSDTTAARLDERISGPREYARYLRSAVRRQRRQAVRRWRDGVNLGQVLVGIDQASDLAGRLIYKLQDLSDRPTTSFLSALNKGAFVASSALRASLGVAALTVAGMVVSSLLGSGRMGAIPIEAVLASPWYWGAVGLVVLRTYRVVQFRLGEVDR